MPELILVRHAQASFGTGDYDRLSELGHRQARWLGEYFRDHERDFDHILSGDMVRHRETVAGIVSGLGSAANNPETNPAWNEFDFEAIVTAYLEQFPEEAPGPAAKARTFSRLLRNALQAWSEDRLESPLPERWTQFESRIEDALSALLNRRGEHTRILLVSSGGAIAMVLRRILQAPASAMVHMNLQMRNCSFSNVFFGAQNLHFSAFNQVPHLDRPDRCGSITYF